MASLADQISLGNDRGRLDSVHGPVLYAAVETRDGAAVQVISVDQRMELVTLSTLTYGISALVVLLLVAVAGWFVTGRLFSPLRRLRDTADAITIDDLGTRLRAHGNDEISDLTTSVNSMLDRLAMSVDAQRQLLDDVRHELKTPITIVRGHLEMMDPADPHDVTETRDLGIAELDRLARLVDDIDTLADVESGALEAAVIDVGSLTDRVAELAGAIPGHTWTVEQRARGRIHATPIASSRRGSSSRTTPRSTPPRAPRSRSAARRTRPPPTSGSATTARASPRPLVTACSVASTACRRGGGSTDPGSDCRSWMPSPRRTTDTAASATPPWWGDRGPAHPRDRGAVPRRAPDARARR